MRPGSLPSSGEEFAAMRTFTLGSVPNRKFVMIEVKGPRLRVTRGDADGTTERSEEELGSEADARSASERVARDLISRGFVEQTASGPKKAKPAGTATPAAAPPKPAARSPEPEAAAVNLLF